MGKKPQKGCGKPTGYMHGNEQIKCGEYLMRETQLCPACSGNHSPSSRKRAGLACAIHTEDKEPDAKLVTDMSETSGSDFDLSEKIDEYGVPSGGKVVYVKDVKTFIKKDTKNFADYLRGRINLTEYWEKRKKLVGKKLR